MAASTWLEMCRRVSQGAVRLRPWSCRLASVSHGRVHVVGNVPARVPGGGEAPPVELQIGGNVPVRSANNDNNIIIIDNTKCYCVHTSE
jgi:hypothetical protein